MMEKKRRRTLASVSKAAMTASDALHWVWEATNDDSEKLMRRERKAAAREAYARAGLEAAVCAIRERAVVFHEAAALAVAWRECKEAKEAKIKAASECERRAMAAAAAVAQEMLAQVEAAAREVESTTRNRPPEKPENCPCPIHRARILIHERGSIGIPSYRYSVCIDIVCVCDHR